MIVISHRALLDGPNKNLENHPDQINFAISKGFDVEIDLWKIDGKLYLGHDEPTYQVADNYLMSFDARYVNNQDNIDKVWVHCKNIQMAYHMTSDVNKNYINYFFHNTDDITLTNKNYLWTYPNAKLELTPRSIAVLPESILESWEGLWDVAAGVCTDYPLNYLDD